MTLVIDLMQKGVSLFLSYTNMNKVNSLHQAKELPKISLQFEAYTSKNFKVRAVSDLRDLYVNKIQGLTSLDSNFCNLYDRFLGRKYWYHSKDPVQMSIYVQFQRCICIKICICHSITVALTCALFSIDYCNEHQTLDLMKVEIFP